VLYYNDLLWLPVGCPVPNPDNTVRRILARKVRSNTRHGRRIPQYALERKTFAEGNKGRPGHVNLASALRLGARLVTVGPYRCVRHAMIAVICCGLSGATGLSLRALTASMSMAVRSGVGL
jgi:hypothetical protein